MIYTITLNPSIDYFIEVHGPMMDTEVNRASNEKFKGGGKGINVSMVLSELQIASTAIALLGGFTGNFIQEYLETKKYITLNPVPVEGVNRINVKIHNDDNSIYINGNGPKATEVTKKKIIASLQPLKSDDWVILSGSSTTNIDYDFIKKLAELIHEKKAYFVMDMERITFEQLQELQPDLIKPNAYEFSLLMNTTITEQNVEEQIEKALHNGLSQILLSLGADGAIYANQNSQYRLRHESIQAINKVGSGDAMLAAFVGKQSQGESIQESLKWAGACGNAAVTTLNDLNYDEIAAFLKNMNVEVVS